MKRFFKENITLFAGIALPLILIGFFLIAGQIGKTTVPDPQYDLVFAVDYYKNIENRLWNIDIESGKIVIRKRKGDKNEYSPLPRLYVFDRKTLSAARLDLDFEKTDSEGVLSSPLIESLNKRPLFPTPVSPDGYRLEYFGRNGTGMLGEIFGMRGHPWYYVLAKGARTIPLKGQENLYNAEFIAWVGDVAP